MALEMETDIRRLTQLEASQSRLRKTQKKENDQDFH